MATRRGLALALVAGVGATLTVSALMHWGVDRSAMAAVRLVPDDAAVTARGQAVYAGHCAACHGERMEGQPAWREPGPDGRLPAPPHDASGHTWHHPDELLFRITKQGVAKAANLHDHASAMPAFEGVLSDAEIVATLSWIKSQWPADIRARHDEINRAARR